MRAVILAKIIKFRDFVINSENIAISIGVIWLVSATKFPIVICNFRANPHRVDIAVGVFRQYCHLSSQYHVRFYANLNYIYCNCDILVSRPPEFRIHLWFLEKIRHYSYQDWDISTSRPPEFPSPCAILWGNLDHVAIAIGVLRRRGSPGFRSHVRFFGEFG